MLSTSLSAAERRRRVERMERLSKTMDSRFKLPGVGLRVGWDSILGLVPGMGDIVTAGPSVLMICEASRLGARKRAMARMGLNTGVDMVLGGIPVLGDAFDVFFKSHRRNATILRSELDRIEVADGTNRKDATWQTESDPATDTARPMTSLAPKAPSSRPDGLAAPSSATSQPRTR